MGVLWGNKGFYDWEEGVILGTASQGQLWVGQGDVEESGDKDGGSRQTCPGFAVSHLPSSGLDQTFLTWVHDWAWRSITP